jgi:hypothetical protein
MSQLRDLISLGNLKKQEPLGQVATLLILMITVVLIFTLVVVNIGEVAKYTAKTSIAADLAALLFASQVGTKSTLISEQLSTCGDGQKCCVATGMLSAFLAVIFAIVAVVVTWGMATPYVIAIAAAAGAAGGAIGGAIAGTGAWTGAIQGAIIGATIGGGSEAGLSGGFELWFNVDAIPAASMLISQAIGASLGASLATSATLYNASVQDQSRGDIVAEVAKGLNGLPEKERIREGVFYRALSGTVDDPNQVKDTYDCNGNGYTDDFVPSFSYCWDRRITALHNSATGILNATQQEILNFLKNPGSPVNNFLTAVSNFQAQIAEGSNGSVMYLLGGLYQAGYHPSFWVPGRSPSGEADDELDRDADMLNLVSAGISGIMNENITDLVNNWKQWVPHFYDEAASLQGASGVQGDLYTYLYQLINGQSGNSLGLRGWINEITTIRNSLPACVYDASCISILCVQQPPPCRGICGNPNFATVDCDLTDDFQPAIDAINTFIQAAEQVRAASQAFYYRMQDFEKVVQITGLGCSLNGTNPVTYGWTDSRGDHTIKVEIGPYPYEEPRTIETSSGDWFKGEKCVELINYQQSLWVSVERIDPSMVKVGRDVVGPTGGRSVLGIWNPFYGGRIYRKATAQYHGIKGSGWVKIVE